ncbi:MAG: hypothetical protein Q7U20_04465 [Caulobacter sp.]|nr:hypothetical protein [Caulobacter sp.]
MKVGRAVNLDRVVWALEEFSDRQMQLRVWANVENADGEMSSFVEASCGLFDDSGLGLALDSDQTGLPDKIVEDLAALDGALRRAENCSDRPILDFIETSEMARVRELATQLLSKLQELRS